MKAKRFEQLRKSSQIYLVWQTAPLFGKFYGKSEEILARSCKEAAIRFHDRKHDSYSWRTSYSSEKFANLKVIPKRTPFERFAQYFD